MNIEGNWQSFDAAATVSSVTRGRAGALLRVLGNELEMPDCDYRSAAEINDELAQRDRSRSSPTTPTAEKLPLQ